jgi:hypothetical protein
MTETTSALNTMVTNKSRYEKINRHWANGEILVGLVVLLVALF